MCCMQWCFGACISCVFICFSGRQRIKKIMQNKKIIRPTESSFQGLRDRKQGLFLYRPYYFFFVFITSRTRSRSSSRGSQHYHSQNWREAFLCIPLCYYYLRVLYLRIFAIWKNRKIKYPQKFLPTHHALWCSTITNWVMFPLWNTHNHSLLIVSAFSFLPSCAITSSRKWRLMTSMIVGVLRAFVLTGERVHAAPCGMFHVQPGAVKLVLWHHWMHLNFMHQVLSENQFHWARL